MAFALVCNAQTNVTEADLNNLLQLINSRLSAIDSKLGVSGGYDCVDLGLSVKWATMNVGATEVAGTKTDASGRLACLGQRFAWGDIRPKETYSWTDLTYCEGEKAAGPFTKYVTSSDYGTADGIATLETGDDVACKYMAGTWRTPTKSEFLELKTNCYCEWTDDYNGTGVSGMIVYKAKMYADRGKLKAKGSEVYSYAEYTLSDVHIFFPAVTQNFSYWTSDLADPCNKATFVGLSSTSFYFSTSYRAVPYMVRAVCPL